MSSRVTDETIPRRAPIGEPMGPETTSAAERAARIDALMALPIKQRPKITVFGDDDVIGINPAPPASTT
jgi:hypothetical protein